VLQDQSGQLAHQEDPQVQLGQRDLKELLGRLVMLAFVELLDLQALLEQLQQLLALQDLKEIQDPLVRQVL
jgi:hypothetical protein